MEGFFVAFCVGAAIGFFGLFGWYVGNRIRASEEKARMELEHVGEVVSNQQIQWEDEIASYQAEHARLRVFHDSYFVQPRETRFIDTYWLNGGLTYRDYDGR